MDALVETSGHTSQRQQRRKKYRRRKKKLTTVPEEHATDEPITPPVTPVSAPLLDYGITTADPAVTWAILRELSIQHGSHSDIREMVGLPRLPDQSFRLGRGPGPSRPPWSFFPAAPTSEPTLPAAAAPPVHSPEPLTDLSTAPMMPGSIVATSPTSVPDSDALAAFDPDMDDLLDDF